MCFKRSLNVLLRGALSAPLFFFASVCVSADVNFEAEVKRLSIAPTWHALLHMQGKKTLLHDPEFIFSLPNFSPTDELKLTFDLFQRIKDGRAPQHSVCKFVARYQWLTQQVPELLSVDPFEVCEGLKEFWQLAPADHVSVVFASEDVSRPSTMMGHVLLKISGSSGDGSPRSHAVSFYTDTRTLNVPLLMVQALITGKRGFYALTPYADKERQYLHDDQRSLWEYSLDAPEQAVTLLRLHMWELRFIDHTYLFHRYNCATLTLAMLALLDPKLLASHAHWDTPGDVVKAISKSKLVSSVTVTPAPKWAIRTLIPAVSDQAKARIKSAVQDGDLPDLNEKAELSTRFLEYSLARSYASLTLQKEALDGAVRTKLNDAMNRPKPDEFNDLQIDLTGYRDPRRRPQDSQWRFAYVNEESSDFLQFEVLPISHALDDDNRQYMSESELRLFSLRGEVDLNSGSATVSDFQIYAVAARTPWDSLAGGWSADFKIGYEQHRDLNLEEVGAINVSGGFGATTSVFRDVYAYGLVSAGAGVARGNDYIYTGPKFGLIANLRGRNKILINAESHWNQLGSRDWLEIYGVQWVNYYSQSNAVTVKIEHLLTDNADATRLTMGYRRYF